MRALIVAIIAAIAISLTWQASDAAPTSNQQQARNLGECVRLANTRGGTARARRAACPSSGGACRASRSERLRTAA